MSDSMSGIIRLDKLGDYVEIQLNGHTDLRSQVDVLLGLWGATVIQVKGSLIYDLAHFYEIDTAARITTAENFSTVVNVRGFARVRLVVTTVTATAGTFAVGHLHAFTPIGAAMDSSSAYGHGGY